MSTDPFDIVRFLLGANLVYAGLNGFFQWRPLPPMNPAMTDFNRRLHETKIIFPVVKVFEIVFGGALLIGRWTLLATAALAPVTFFIVLSHLVFNRPRGFAVAALFTAAHAVLIYHHRNDLMIFLQP